MMNFISLYYRGNPEERIAVNNLGLPPDLLEYLEEIGIIEIRDGAIDQTGLRRAFKALRLRALGVNMAGAAIILDLLDRIESLQDEIERIKK